jgi:hypothetical protein
MRAEASMRTWFALAAASAWAGLGGALVGCVHHHVDESVQGDAGDDSEVSDGASVDEGPPLLPKDAGSTDAAHDAMATVDAPGPTPTCAPGAELVYVASEERNLYSFDPKTAAFSLLGNIDCAAGSYVNSMAIDRNAMAWINYGDGSLWKTDTQHPTCQSTGFLPNQQGVGLFGMGFAAKSAGSNTDLLFIDDLSGGGLGFIDLSNMTLMRLGPFTGGLANQTCELTGTSDAQLFGFFSGGPLMDASTATVAKLDPNTETATTQWPLPGVNTGSDWAFAAWGGDFFLFTADKYSMVDPYTTVTRLHPGDGTLTTLAMNIGFRVVGAGSSTCAPLITQ